MVLKRRQRVHHAFPDINEPDYLAQRLILERIIDLSQNRHIIFLGNSHYQVITDGVNAQLMIFYDRDFLPGSLHNIISEKRLSLKINSHATALTYFLP